MVLTIVTPERKSASVKTANDVLAVLDDLKVGRFYSIGRLSKFIFITDVTPDVEGRLFNVPVVLFAAKLFSEMLFEPAITDVGAVFLKNEHNGFVMQILTKDNSRSNEIFEASRVGSGFVN